ncbi:thiopeptide-type bacteriocin biosynthesis domain-containing protein [Mucilaginibacter pineti]|uniref:Thiopeptide-type bacteriocin biosynthesis domain-containing protein n=1 Tax=Mucilaginibacter pineti TaxID=1391627 RepID=A0A1G7GI25_9SPHI|nr:lantibiotic dehydratase [Mucilaginibacter pineti]SDE87669.1 thiopeptide-type bacteriocin biosynthesis domain-containing protein [Mucilaginibacter pineti]
MKISVFDQAIYRVPQFHISAILENSWEELKESIKLASSDFYDQIKDTNADNIYSLPKPIFHTVWKYFNRAKFRATPYGSFAGFGLAHIDAHMADSSIIICPSQKLHSFIAWPYKGNVKITTELLLQNGGYLIANDSHYIILDSIRYLSYIDDKFELSEIELDSTVHQILQICKRKIRASDLQEASLHLFSNAEQFIEAINYLISLQLLFTSCHPNIIGEEYFERIGITNTPSLPQYVIAERQNIQGNINHHVFKDITELTLLLHQIVPIRNNATLDKFIFDFTRKFERREVPVMEALDPEIGIGYGDLVQTGDHQALVVEIVNKNKEAATSNNDHHLKDFLYKELLQNSGINNHVISLEKLPVNNDAVKTLPNTFNAVLSDAFGMLCLESLGGATSNGIAGRFTLASDEVTDYCKRIAEIEQQANPGVLFFDIGYTAENHVDNINRRRAIYGMQLNLLNYDLSQNPLEISDLYLHVLHGELILRSKKHNKRLVPRMASAYNYGRSDLPLFRLLCDLQNQGIANNLSINFQHLIPGLNYYPRIQFKNIIISRSKWLLSFSDLKLDAQHNAPERFRELLKSKSISRYCKAGTGDQTLLFDTESNEDMVILMEYLKKRKTLLIEEAFQEQQGLVKDDQGRVYCSEWIVALYHDKEIYKATKSKSEIQAVKHQTAILPPGKEWLYFEIFSHPQRADSILINQITTLLKDRKRLICRWFFIRYTENGFHLRLRLQLHNANKAQLVITDLSELLKEEIQTGIVSDFTIRTYKRELARYGSLNMERVENHFHADSTYVLNVLKQSPEVNTLYATCREIVLSLRDSNVFNSSSFDDMLDRISNSMNEEHQANPASYKKLNEAYKVYRNAMPLAAGKHPKLKSFSESFLSTIRFCVPSGRYQLFADLMHMHINRLFTTEQRTHEMIFYYFLTKDIKERKARANFNPKIQTNTA